MRGTRVLSAPKHLDTHYAVALKGRLEGFMFGARVTRSGRAMVGIVIGSILWAMVASVALAADKTFSATVSPGPLVAGASYGEGARASSKITLTIVNESNQSRLGSANVTVPTGILPTLALPSVGTTPAAIVGQVIQLRSLDLAPTASVTVSISARVECDNNHPAYDWSFVVKQANDFNGIGNDLAMVGLAPSNSVTGNCSIAFSKQPKSSEKAPTIIRSKIYDPNPANPVTVTVLDSAGFDKVAWWSGSINLSKGNDPTPGHVAVLGGTSGTDIGGAFTFAPTIDLSATGYTIQATATPTVGSSSVGTSTTAITSDAFNIVDDATICAENTSCGATSQGPKTKAQVDATANGGAAGDLVILAINDPTFTIDCAGYTETSDQISYNVTGSDGSAASGRAKLATFTLSAQFVTKSASKYEVCYTSNQAFPDKNGNLVTTGLLPACVNKTLEPSPCVVSKVIDKLKNLVLVVSSPPGDPTGKF
jgi:hypothetical protein